MTEVALFVSAWIEIDAINELQAAIQVALFVSAWIEIIALSNARCP